MASTPGFSPRPYQREAVRAVLDALAAGQTRPAVVLPTGAGKTVVFSQVIRDWIEWARYGRVRDPRVLVLAHRAELLEQAAEKIRAVCPDLKVGTVKAGVNQVYADVVVASTQTLASEKRRAAIKGVGLIIVDECHHATAATYRKILEHYQCPAVGFTATMSRGDDAALGDIWQDIVYKRDIAEMIRDGYLCGVRGVRVQVPDLDLRRVKRLAGDYSEAALGAALEGSLAPQLIAKAWNEHASGKQGLLFAPTVSSAEFIAAELVAQGISAELVHGAMKTDDRAAALDRFRNGKVQVLANCMVLTEGTDLPMAEVIAVARPTTNQALYVQMVGRGLRLYPGKQRATVLDLVGATAKHSLMSPVKLFGEQLDALDKDVVELDPAELAELEEIELLREQEAGEAVGAGQVWIEGDLEAIEVDLFHGSASAWQRTHAGVWFLPAGDRFIALVRGEAGTGWDVVWMHKYRHGVSGWVARGMPDLGYAMATAEGNVQPGEELTTSRDRAWKAKAPSEKTVALAQRYGIEVHSLMRAGEVSALITLVEASRRIDPVQVARGLEKVGV